MAARPPARAAFTLVEVILVMALLVVIASMAMPVLTGTMSRSRLRNAGDVIRTAWQRARLAAMETGQVHIFRCQLKGRQFHVLSIAELLEVGKGNAKLENVEETDDFGSLRLRFDRLPTGVTFASGQVAPAPQLASMYGTVLGGEWSSPIVFQPDGTCNDASIVLTNEETGWTVRVTVRGLTGSVRVGEVSAEKLK